MSRKFLVVFLTSMVLIAVAAVGQTRCPSPTVATTVQSDRANFTNSNSTFNDPSAQYTVTVTNALTHATVATVTSTGTGSTATVTGLQANTPYQASSTVTSSSCTTSAPTTVSATTAPPPPTGISGIGGLQKVTVSWTAAPGATSYQLTLSNGMSFTTNTTSYIVTGLQTATSYNAIVASINAAGVRGSFSPAVVVRTANVALQ